MAVEIVTPGSVNSFDGVEAWLFSVAKNCLETADMNAPESSSAGVLVCRREAQEVAQRAQENQC